MVHLDAKHSSASASSDSTGDEDIFAMDDAELGMSPDASPATVPARLAVVLKKEFDKDAFKRIVQHLSRRRVDILKATLARIEGYGGQHFVILTCHVRIASSILDADPTFVAAFCEEIKRLPYVDQEVLRWLDSQSTSLPLFYAELAVALAKLVHCLLDEERPLVFTPYHIDEFMRKHPEILDQLLRFFSMK